MVFISFRNSLEIHYTNTFHFLFVLKQTIWYLCNKCRNLLETLDNPKLDLRLDSAIIDWKTKFLDLEN